MPPTTLNSEEPAKVHTCWPMRVVGNRQADGSVRGMCCSGGYDLRVQVEYLTL